MRRATHVKVEKVPTNLLMHSGYHYITNSTSDNSSITARRKSYPSNTDGGFCEVRDRFIGVSIPIYIKCNIEAIVENYWNLT